MASSAKLYHLNGEHRLTCLPEPAIAREERFQHMRDKHRYADILAMNLAVDPRIVFEFSREGWFNQYRQLLRCPVRKRPDLQTGVNGGVKSGHWAA